MDDGYSISSGIILFSDLASLSGFSVYSRESGVEALLPVDFQRDFRSFCCWNA